MRRRRAAGSGGEKQWWEDPRAKEWLRNAQDKLPKLVGDSGIFMSLCPDGEPDAKFCVELGFALMLDKPLMLVAVRGERIPDKLRAVADMVIEYDGGLDETAQKLIQDGLSRMMERFGHD